MKGLGCRKDGGRGWGGEMSSLSVWPSEFRHKYLVFSYNHETKNFVLVLYDMLSIEEPFNSFLIFENVSNFLFKISKKVHRLVWNLDNKAK